MKKIWWVLSTTPIIASPFVVISCTKINDKYYDSLRLNDTFFGINNLDEVGKIFDKKYKETVITDLETRKEEVKERSFWEKFFAIEGVVDSVVDGDTLYVKVTNGKLHNKQHFNNGEIIKIRIPMIDTLEEYDKASPKERALASIDSAFAKKMVPVGTKVRVITENWANKSHDRVIGYVFFGNNFEKEWDIEMLRNGLALPRVQESAFKNFLFDYDDKIKSSPASYLIPYVAKAFNEGWLQKRGFYKKGGNDINLNGKKKSIKFKNPEEFATAYEAHGKALINDAYRFFYPTVLPKGVHSIFKNDKNNFYEFLIKQKENK
ncbi:Hypothetical protein, predicted lipoprotein [Metamycoplasma auris 15026]|uniref:TNase-like domain-containing protein n=1 Tax=Metamycoplasma auris 15026 TaxID=1188233 RepID=N9VB19_9BACT|nr:hypothetical protein [Metamycoplasma auris]ENY68596.1 Hypothetical protein, predicted lipoprotein [Metamycoplasma auris 15026]